MLKKAFIQLVVLAAALTACTHAPEVGAPAIPVRSPCANIDWFETGRADGAAGSPLEKLATYQERCDRTPFPVKIDQYTTGRETGLVEYCSPTGGLEAGKNLRLYEKVCPENRETVFLQQYELGKRIRILENDRADLEARIINLRNLLPANARPDSSIRLQIELLKSRQAQLMQEMSVLESKGPSSSLSPAAQGTVVN